MNRTDLIKNGENFTIRESAMTYIRLVFGVNTGTTEKDVNAQKASYRTKVTATLKLQLS